MGTVSNNRPSTVLIFLWNRILSHNIKRVEGFDEGYVAK